MTSLTAELKFTRDGPSSKEPLTGIWERLTITTEIPLIVRAESSLEATLSWGEQSQVLPSGKKSLPWKLPPGDHQLSASTGVTWRVNPNPEYIRANNTKLGPTGLINQLTHFIHATVIADKMGRTLVEPTFLPNYDKLESIPLSAILDLSQQKTPIIEHLDENVEWSTKYLNTLTQAVPPSPLSAIIEKLREETHPALDVGSCYRLKDLNPEQELRLFHSLKFTPVFDRVVDYCQELIGGEYSAVHYRLEDDWIAEMGRVYLLAPTYAANFLHESFAAHMESVLKKNEKIYLATHLTKASHRFNYMIKKLEYPNLLLNLPWREKFPEVPQGREIDALVEFLICRRAKKFIGLWESTFARLIGKLNQFDGKFSFVFDCRSCRLLPFNITSYKSPFKIPGLRGRMGFPSVPDEVIVRGADIQSIAAHAPSEVKIKIQQPLMLQGYINPSAAFPHELTFSCNGQPLGKLHKSGQKTPWIELPPGEHLLEVTTNKGDWAHSIWLLDKVPTETPKVSPSSELINMIKERVPQGTGRVLVFGNSKLPLEEKIVYRFKEQGLEYASDLARTNTVFDLLWIEENPIDLFPLFHGFVAEGGLIVVQKPKFLPEYTLGPVSEIYSDENFTVLRRDPVPQTIKFGIVMATYYRKNGNTKKFLERSLQSILKQTYQNYKVFLIGDKYERDDEFSELVKLIPQEKIRGVNLPVAWEREHSKNQRSLWMTGGANAMNTGMNLALGEGIVHYIHLDDDDYWHPHHLRNLAAGYQQFPETSFICTVGHGPEFGSIPANTGYHYNNFECRGKNVYHSAYGFRLDRIPFRYTSIVPGGPEPQYPADAEMLNRVGATSEKKLVIPMMTCLHDFEASPHIALASNGHLLDELSDEILRSQSYRIVGDLSQKIKTFHHHYHLLYDLRTLLGPEKITYCEIGVFQGASMALMLQHPYPSRIIGIDNFMESSHELVLENAVRYNPLRREVTIHHRDSHIPGLLNEPIDLLFIDGDHSLQGVIADFEVYSPLVREGGIIVFDDYYDKEYSPEVKLGVDQIVEKIKSGHYTGFEIIGSLQNQLRVHPQNFPMYNEFILRRGTEA